MSLARAPETGLDPARRALSVLIVTRDSASQIGTLLAGIHAECRQLDAEVIVLDNASCDGTPELIAREHAWVSLRRSLTNLGFAVAANQASRLAEGHCLLLLHPEAVPAPGCITRGLAMMRDDAGIAVAGGVLLGADEVRQAPARRLPAWLGDTLALRGLAARQPASALHGRFDRRGEDAELAADVDWVSGAFLFVRTEVFKSLGGFDERFFHYYEDIDLCRRARRVGWRVRHWPALQARCIDGAASQDEGPETLPSDPHGLLAPMTAPGAELALWHIRSSLLYHRKHHGGLPTWLLHRLERAWQRLRAWHNARGHRIVEAHDACLQLARLRRAWDETFGGRVSPPRPW